MDTVIESFERALEDLPPHRFFGRVTAIQGMLVEIGGADRHFSIGGRCTIEGAGGSRIPCEVVGFRDGRSLVLPLGPLDGIGLGCRAEIGTSQPAVFPSSGWLGRVVNALGEPIDGKGPLPTGGNSRRCAAPHRLRISGSALVEKWMSVSAP